jgi:NAD+ synthase (glutamine-hydrolysing)
LADPVGLVEVPHAWPARAPAPAPVALEEWEASASPKEEELTRAVALGLFDYVRKSRANGFVVSLSGGADSSAVCCLVRLMAELAIAELGVAGVHERMAHIPGIARCADITSLMQRVLVTLYQSSANSSETTRAAACTVAAVAGGRHLEISVAGVISSYMKLVSQARDRELTWADDDIALQNIQARARGPSAWLIANVEGSLLLATSNRSEAALGYATMDGDTCGGLSPIAGIDKAFLRHWLEWLQSQGPCGLAPRPELAAVTQQASTPELRPAGALQTSEGDLMPFAVLDRIERHLVRDRRSPGETAQLLAAELPALPTTTIRDYVTRFYTLFARNQWKRERYAPSFHLDDENLDPKTWFRFPILSGGFARELAELNTRS